MGAVIRLLDRVQRDSFRAGVSLDTVPAPRASERRKPTPWGAFAMAHYTREYNRDNLVAIVPLLFADREIFRARPAL